MILLSNALWDTPDEGSLKAAVSLARELKGLRQDVTVVSYERRCALTDRFLKLNKLLLNPSLYRLLGREDVVYLPFPTRPLPMAARIFLLSRLAPGQVTAVLSMTGEQGPLSRLLLRGSRARIAVLSEPARERFAAIVGNHRVLDLRAGVDTAAFYPVVEEERQALRKTYGLDPHRRVVLHVGHLKPGRNLKALLQVDPGCQVLLVLSSFTRDQADPELRRQLESRENIRILEGYRPGLRELYQLADVYLFPVTQANNCIDLPLSCLEAAACGTPVVTTGYGGLGDLPGFALWDGRDAAALNRALAAAHDRQGARASALSYDWAAAAGKLCLFWEGEKE